MAARCVAILRLRASASWCSSSHALGALCASLLLPLLPQRAPQNLAQSTRPMAPSSSRMMPHMISLFCRMRLLMVDRIWRLREMCVSTWGHGAREGIVAGQNQGGQVQAGQAKWPDDV